MRNITGLGLFLAILLSLNTKAQAGPNDTIWTPLFNGSDKIDWDVKITGHPLNWDSLNTFRVAPCVNDTGNCLELNYANYTNWNGNPWGRAAYKLRPFSYYYLRAKYQIFGTQTTGTPPSAMQQSAILLHSQTMASLGLNQDWPNAIENQLVGPGNKLNAVGTSNLCADGMAFQNAPTGALNHTHCTNVIANPMTLAPTWTTVSALVLADSLIDFFVGTKSVITFYKPVQWNDNLITGNTISIVNGTPVTGDISESKAKAPPSVSKPWRSRTWSAARVIPLRPIIGHTTSKTVLRHALRCMWRKTQKLSPAAFPLIRSAVN